MGVWKLGQVGSLTSGPLPLYIKRTVLGKNKEAAHGEEERRRLNTAEFCFYSDRAHENVPIPGQLRGKKDTAPGLSHEINK